MCACVLIAVVQEVIDHIIHIIDGIQPPKPGSNLASFGRPAAGRNL
jgi:hypothetical protein